jgi:histidyl-tRNA synthetase
MTLPMRPRGTRDWRGPDLHAQLHVEARCRHVFATFGFEPVRPPGFEAYHLLESRYGEAIRERLFTFYADREYALRPDLTGPVARMVVDGVLRGEPLPYALSYVGPCWRYERSQELRYREFRQAGVELVGAPAGEADGEMLACAAAVLDELGLTEPTFRLGHAGLLGGHLRSMPETAPHADRLLRELDGLHRVGARLVDAEPSFVRSLHADLLARQQAVLRFGDSALPRSLAVPEELSEEDLGAFAAIAPQRMAAILRASWNVELGVPPGVAERMITLATIAAQPGELEEALGDALAEPDVRTAFEQLVALPDRLPAAWRRRATLAPGAARGLAYYTGMTFEIELAAFLGQKQICGGGRFDRLTADLGGRALPAAGFAFGIERLAAAVVREGRAPARRRPVYVAAVDPAGRVQAVELAHVLRSRGLAVHRDLLSLPLNEQLGEATSRGAFAAVLLGPDERTRGAASVRWLDERRQEELPLDALAGALQAGGGA